ncbi:c-type cytochrome [Acuticoccus sp. MNP-M23]|uniref:c-type cytochrome n=1 Tax=Acuticoccus sp. MNP-M23 TaxID=3072793 RepID=UPI00281628B4|nr:c-type cytochrome [Acuticoccus sp. MNP-M23]WMS41455.1 c-type cytochrome [Acuticoccus sp. MNP-M23]
MAGKRLCAGGRPRAALLLLLAGLGATPAAAQDLFHERQAQCIACHGTEGVSQNAEVPSLGGIDDYYALLQLVAFRAGNRENAVMQAVMDGMSDNDLRAASAWVASLPDPPPPDKPGAPDRMAAARTVSEANRCNGCHGADYRGGHQMPPLRNQREDYLTKALLDYKHERRIGDRAAMVEVVQDLTADDLAELAYFLAHLPAP